MGWVGTMLLCLNYKEVWLNGIQLTCICTYIYVHLQKLASMKMMLQLLPDIRSAFYSHIYFNFIIKLLSLKILNVFCDRIQSILFASIKLHFNTFRLVPEIWLTFRIPFFSILRHYIWAKITYFWSFDGWLTPHLHCQTCW